MLAELLGPAALNAMQSVPVLPPLSAAGRNATRLQSSSHRSDSHMRNATACDADRQCVRAHLQATAKPLEPIDFGCWRMPLAPSLVESGGGGVQSTEDDEAIALRLQEMCRSSDSPHRSALRA